MTSRPVRFVPWLAGVVGGVGIACGGVIGAGCTSGNITADAGAGTVIQPDGAVTSLDGGLAAPGFACAFVERASYTCPDVTLPPPSWEAQCVDGDDCKSRVNGTAKVAGCTESLEYQDVSFLTQTCAAWRASGGKEPTIDSGPLPACAPGAATAFAPKWHPPRAKTTACSKGQIDAYRQCLDDSATVAAPPSCEEWTKSVSAIDQTCLTCLTSNESDATYGPLVLLPTETIVNVAGCLALAEAKTDGSGCGGALSADGQCDRAACLPTCPTRTASEVAGEVACEKQADQGVCATYATAAECAGAIQAGDAGSDAGTDAERACFGLPGGSADAVFEAVALAFCGGP